MTIQTTYKKNSHCSSCGAVFLDTSMWPRICDRCKNVSYKNPTPVSIVIVPFKRRFFSRTGVLLVRRDGGLGNPGYGKLALPGGFQDTKECSSKAGVREALEEVGLNLNHRTLTLFHVEYAEPPDVQMIFWLAPTANEYQLNSFTKNTEVSDVIITYTPQIELAFSSHERALKLFFSRGNALQRALRFFAQALRW